MPIPRPSKDESRDKFISRCMGDKVMNKEFPERQQRYAVCNKAWERKTQSTIADSTKVERIIDDFFARHPELLGEDNDRQDKTD